MSTLLPQALSAYGAGFLTSLSPCVYPMLPITIGYLGTQAGSGKKSRIVLYALGQSAAFVLLGVAAVRAGEAFGFTSQIPAIRIVVGLLLAVAGALALYGRLPPALARLDVSRAIERLSSRMSPSLAALGLGFGAALIMSPCTTPVLSGVLALIATGDSAASGIWLIAAYAVGFSTLILVVGLGLVQSRFLPRGGKWMVYLHKAGAVALLAFGVYYIATALA